MSIAATGLARPGAGRTSIRSQAIRRIVAAATAELAGVPVQAVRAQLADAHGGLAVSVSTPVDLGVRTAGTLLERAAMIVETISSRLDALAGRSVTRVELRFSGPGASRGRSLR